MRRGLSYAFMVILAAAAGTAWLYFKIQYGDWLTFRKELEQRFSPPELQTIIRSRHFRQQTLPLIQQALQEKKLDGWLFSCYEFQDPIALDLLLSRMEASPSRRWFYWIPASGQPEKLLHRVDADHLSLLPGRLRLYAGWQEMLVSLKNVLTGSRRVAMQYSAPNAIPAISRVDATTLEQVQEMGVTVVSAGDLIQRFVARWEGKQEDQHRRAAGLLADQVRYAFEEVRSSLSAGENVTEGRLVQFLQLQFQRAGIWSELPPVVAFGRNTAKPEYQVPTNGGSQIELGGLLLVDVAAYVLEPDAVYADATWVAYVGKEVPPELEEAFSLLVKAREKALETIQKGWRESRTVEGWEVDRASRMVLEARGWGNYFFHRTGYSLGRSRVGWGATLDSLESHDTRPIVAGLGYSIRPGIYMRDFGMRTGINVYISSNGPEVTTLPTQDRIVALLAAR